MGKRRHIKPTNGPTDMEMGKFYDLPVPANIKGKFFDRVKCIWRNTNKPNEYMVEGVPRGGEKLESFILVFTSRGRVKAVLSEDQKY